MSIRKRTLPSGQVRWQHDYVDQQGVRRARQFATQKQAKEHETVVRGEIRAGLHTADRASITIAKAGDLWLEQCRLDHLEAATIKGYEQHLRLHILPLIGKNVRLTKLTRPAVEAFKKQLLHKTQSRTTAIKILTSLKCLLSEAMKNGHISQNVAVGVRMKKVNARHAEEDAIPTKDEIRSFITKSAELWPFTWQRPMIVLAIFTGMRASELRGLSWANVDFDRRVIQVQERADFKNKLGSPKSKAGKREISMSPMVANVLRQWKLSCGPEADLVFRTTKHGNVICHAEMWRMWQQLLEAVGLEPMAYRFHDLRHAAASLFIDQGMPPKQVQTIMGHASIIMTFDKYGHLFPCAEDDAAAMADVEARLLRPI